MFVDPKVKPKGPLLLHPLAVKLVLIMGLQGVLPPSGATTTRFPCQKYHFGNEPLPNSDAQVPLPLGKRSDWEPIKLQTEQLVPGKSERTSKLKDWLEEAATR